MVGKTGEQATVKPRAVFRSFDKGCIIDTDAGLDVFAVAEGDGFSIGSPLIVSVVLVVSVVRVIELLALFQRSTPPTKSSVRSAPGICCASMLTCPWMK